MDPFEPQRAQPPEEQYANVLRQMFPGVTDEIVYDVINIVEEDDPAASYLAKMAKMQNLMSGYGAWGPLPATISEDMVDLYYKNLMEIFPDADPDFMLEFCREQPAAMLDLDAAVQRLVTEGYDRVELDPLLIWEQLKDALPDADPSYLKKEAVRLVSLPQQELHLFLQQAIETNDYPTMKEYLQNKKEQDDLAVYKQFDVDKFLEIFPNPDKEFNSPDRVNALNENSTKEEAEYALTFLYNNYGFVRKKYIDMVFKYRKANLVECCERLDKLGKNMRKARAQEQYKADIKNVALLQEIAYLKHRKLIKRVLKLRDEDYKLLREEARTYNLLQQCQCCFEEELIPEECYFCMKGCVFCKQCVKAGTENAIGDGDLRFPCFNNCDSEFSFQTLQMVLSNKTLEKLVQKIASEEAKKANIQGLETCPFCDFAMILPENEKIFKCINQDCLVESCRRCRHKSHVPLRCEEIEYDEDVRRRTYIENKMTEALTRTCHSCKKVFVKDNGCNKMTCQCGAMQCYLCGAAVDNYKHFGANSCALFSNDNEVNLQRVMSGAQDAKRELGDVEIKFDPSKDIQKFYNA
ncbi:hypothetical protein NQ315_001292 [Exocentrus adspersus]|uniref:RING-type domain-containing protein n=1 Tax=Exocentrus adspersus TaxID=1586481 RepID=A0AAV8WF83_9CUCU|nr:hypothetical protein NQ315_001292 [Exocentrus adspersus]